MKVCDLRTIVVVIINVSYRESNPCEGARIRVILVECPFCISAVQYGTSRPLISFFTRARFLFIATVAFSHFGRKTDNLASKFASPIYPLALAVRIQHHFVSRRQNNQPIFIVLHGDLDISGRF